MKKFSFNLEKILQLRKFKEEEQKLVLGREISVLNKIENEILNTAKKKHNASLQRFNNVLETLSWEVYIRRLEKEAETLTEKAAKQEMVVEEKRALYMEAKKDLMAIEKLKEKRFNEYKKETAKREILEIDELTSARRGMRI